MTFLNKLLCCACLLQATVSVAEPLQIRITDQQGVPLEDAVAELQLPNPPLLKTPAELAQKDLTFVPFVSAVQKGTAVEFPNQDKTRHHVYSFSPAKVFELKLYAGKPEAPVVFDKSGIIAIGCNIHDYMQAYVYVGDSPYLAVSRSDGSAHFADVPAGNYQLKVWHPWQDTDVALQALTLPATGAIEIKLPVTRQQKPQKPKKGFGNSYN